MRIQANYTAIDGASAAVVSPEFVNNMCDVCSIQVTGTFTSATLHVQGIINSDSAEWVNLAVLSLSDYTLATSGISDEGIYECGVEGVSRVRFNLSAVSGGDITVQAQFVNTAAD